MKLSVQARMQAQKNLQPWRGLEVLKTGLAGGAYFALAKRSATAVQLTTFHQAEM